MSASDKVAATGSGFDQLVDTLVDVAAAGERVMLGAPDGADGDSIGSQLALQGILRWRFPELVVEVVNADRVPRRYRSLPGADGVIAAADRQDTRYGLAIVMDGGRARMGAAGAIFDAARIKTLFDHHVIGDECDYDLKVVDGEAAATAEMVDSFRRHPAMDVPLDARIAHCMWVALVFDTGCFRHSSTSPRTLALASELVGTGFDFTRAIEETMLLRRQEGLQLLGRVLGRFERAAAGRFIYSWMNAQDLAETGADSEDREGIIDQLFLIEGCEVAALFSANPAGERGGAVVRCSFRSRSAVDVAALARSLSVHGGGHRKAAGCSLEGDLNEWLPRVRDCVVQAIEANRP